jgi:hypothetical protein
MYNTSSIQSLSTASTYMVLKVQDKAGLGLRFDLDILFVNPFISPQNECQIFTYFFPKYSDCSFVPLLSGRRPFAAHTTYGNTHLPTTLYISQQ